MERGARHRSICSSRGLKNWVTRFSIQAFRVPRLREKALRRAKEGNNLGRVTQSLFYATDFVDRLENEIVPALRAGFVVLTDRYIYSLMARAIVRGMDGAWIRSIFGVALVPDAVFYLRLGIDDLIPRVILFAWIRLLGVGSRPVSRQEHVRQFFGIIRRRCSPNSTG